MIIVYNKHVSKTTSKESAQDLPDEKDCFHNMTCWLPSYEITENNGFTEEEIAWYIDVIRSASNLIIEFSKNGGFEHASGF